MLRMTFKLLILTIIFLQISCGQKYEMTDMQGRQIDISELIESGKFKEHYCEGKIDKLVEINPIALDLNYEDELQKQFAFWFDNNNQLLETQVTDTIPYQVDSLFAKTKYQYSYIINSVDSPIHVYTTDIEVNRNKYLRLFIRSDVAKKLFDIDYTSTDWINNNCDSLNINTIKFP